MLNIHLDDIGDENLLLEGDAEIAELPRLAALVQNGDYSFPGPVSFQFRVYRVSGMIEVEGQLEAVAGLPCSRCLTPYESKVENGFNLTFVEELPDVVIEDDEEGVELSAEEMGLILIEDDSIDLTDVLQDHVIMSLPVRPLCRENCSGLCPHCGANRNEGDCGCEEPVFDTRFAALKDLKIDNKKK